MTPSNRHPVVRVGGRRVRRRAHGSGRGCVTQATEDDSPVALDATDGTERWRVSLASGENAHHRTRRLATAGPVVVTPEKPGVDEPAETVAADRESGGRPVTLAD